MFDNYLWGITALALGILGQNSILIVGKTNKIINPCLIGGGGFLASTSALLSLYCIKRKEKIFQLEQDDALQVGTFINAKNVSTRATIIYPRKKSNGDPPKETLHFANTIGKVGAYVSNASPPKYGEIQRKLENFWSNFDAQLDRKIQLLQDQPPKEIVAGLVDLLIENSIKITSPTYKGTPSSFGSVILLKDGDAKKALVLQVGTTSIYKISKGKVEPVSSEKQSIYNARLGEGSFKDHVFSKLINVEEGDYFVGVTESIAKEFKSFESIKSADELMGRLKPATPTGAGAFVLTV